MLIVALSLVPALVAQLENNSGSLKAYQTRVTDHLIPAISQLAITIGDDVRRLRRFIAVFWLIYFLPSEIMEDVELSGVVGDAKQHCGSAFRCPESRRGLLSAPWRRVSSSTSRGIDSSFLTRIVLLTAVFARRRYRSSRN